MEKLLGALMAIFMPFFANVTALEEPLTYESLRSQIQLRDIRSRAQLLAIIPRSMRRTVKLVHNSCSTVGKTSITEPRMIFSTNSPTSLLVITISGEADSQTVEIAERVNRFSKNIPKVIQFNEAKNARPMFIEEPLKYFKGSRMHCTRCHGESFRWIWDGMYPTWPRAHGGEHLEFISDRQLPLADPLNRELNKFLSTANDHPLYKYLGIESITYANLAINNVNFNERLTKANAGRLTLEVVANSRFYKYGAILSSAFSQMRYLRSDRIETPEAAVNYLNSKEIIDLLPIEDRESFRSSILQISNELYLEIFRFKEDLYRRQLSKRSIVANEEHLSELTIIRFVSRKLGVDMKNWSLQLNRHYTGMAIGEPASNNSFAMAFRDFLRIVTSEKATQSSHRTWICFRGPDQ